MPLIPNQGLGNGMPIPTQRSMPDPSQFTTIADLLRSRGLPSQSPMINVRPGELPADAMRRFFAERAAQDFQNSRPDQGQDQTGGPVPDNPNLHNPDMQNIPMPQGESRSSRDFATSIIGRGGVVTPGPGRIPPQPQTGKPPVYLGPPIPSDPNTGRDTKPPGFTPPPGGDPYEPGGGPNPWQSVKPPDIPLDPPIMPQPSIADLFRQHAQQGNFGLGRMPQFAKPPQNEIDQRGLMGSGQNIVGQGARSSLAGQMPRGGSALNPGARGGQGFRFGQNVRQTPGGKPR